MASPGELQKRLDARFRAACRIFFGKEIGELSKFEKWLREDLEPSSIRKSEKSGKEVTAIGNYPAGAPFISFDEIDYSKKFGPLSMNEMKDVDSLVAALSERAVFSGNVVLGNSRQVEESTGMEDSNFILSCHTMHKCQDLAHCTIGREVRDAFGCSMIGESSFCMQAHNIWRTSRCLCSYRVYECNDIAYSNYLSGCTECMFCFGLKGKRHMIGNAALPKDEYVEIKRKLMGEIAGMLEKKGRAPSIFELSPSSPFPLKKPIPKPKQEPFDESKVQASFDEACSLVLGRMIGSVRDCAGYLGRNNRKLLSRKSAVSGLPVYYGDYAVYRTLAGCKRVVKLPEFEAICSERKWPSEIRPDGLSMANLAPLLEPIALFTTEEDSLSSNTSESSTVHYAANVLRCNRAYHAKDCAYCSWPRDSDHCFGCESTRNSSFCINCYYSWKLTRCFECDTSQNCSGCYFVHNCENVHDSMFCFNAKNLKYAIGNVEMGREKFMAAKAVLLSEITGSLLEKKTYRRSIYSPACDE